MFPLRSLRSLRENAFSPHRRNNAANQPKACTHSQDPRPANEPTNTISRKDRKVRQEGEKNLLCFLCVLCGLCEKMPSHRTAAIAPPINRRPAPMAKNPGRQTNPQTQSSRKDRKEGEKKPPVFPPLRLCVYFLICRHSSIRSYSHKLQQRPVEALGIGEVNHGLN